MTGQRKDIQEMQSNTFSCRNCDIREAVEKKHIAENLEDIHTAHKVER